MIIDITREYIEQLNDIEPYCFETDREEWWFNIGLKHGLEAADANTKSPWISIEEDLPCNHKELMRNEYYTKKVLVILALDDNPTKKHIELCDMCNKGYPCNTNWRWEQPTYYHVTHWFPIPQLPKE